MHISKILTANNRVYISESSIKISRRHRETLSNNTTNDQTTYGSKNYSDGLQQAFNRVKQQVFFNPDMQYFVTLTYKGLDHTVDDVLYDLKQLFKTIKRKQEKIKKETPDIELKKKTTKTKKTHHVSIPSLPNRSAVQAEGVKSPEKIKYIAVLEYQKRGSIHVHMITNQLPFEQNKNKYLHLPDWKKGYSSALHISQFDNNFRPYLYLFKYMKKSQRIGRYFVYASRGLNNFKQMDIDEFDISLYTELATEQSLGLLPDGTPVYFNKYYFLKKEKYHDSNQILH